MLVNVGIQQEISKHQNQLRIKTGVDVEHITGQLKEVAERCMQRVYPLLNRDGSPKLVENADCEMVPGYVFDASGACRTLELLGKHIGFFEKDNSQRLDDYQNYFNRISTKAEEAARLADKRIREAENKQKQ